MVELLPAGCLFNVQPGVATLFESISAVLTEQAAALSETKAAVAALQKSLLDARSNADRQRQSWEAQFASFCLTHSDATTKLVEESHRGFLSKLAVLEDRIGARLSLFESERTTTDGATSAATREATAAACTAVAATQRGLKALSERLEDRATKADMDEVRQAVTATASAAVDVPRALATKVGWKDFERLLAAKADAAEVQGVLDRKADRAQLEETADRIDGEAERLRSETAAQLENIATANAAVLQRLSQLEERLESEGVAASVCAKQAAESAAAASTTAESAASKAAEAASATASAKASAEEAVAAQRRLRTEAVRAADAASEAAAAAAEAALAAAAAPQEARMSALEVAALADGLNGAVAALRADLDATKAEVVSVLNQKAYKTDVRRALEDAAVEMLRAREPAEKGAAEAAVAAVTAGLERKAEASEMRQLAQDSAKHSAELVIRLAKLGSEVERLTTRVRGKADVCQLEAALKGAREEGASLEREAALATVRAELKKARLAEKLNRPQVEQVVQPMLVQARAEAEAAVARAEAKAEAAAREAAKANRNAASASAAAAAAASAASAASAAEERGRQGQGEDFQHLQRRSDAAGLAEQLRHTQAAVAVLGSRVTAGFSEGRWLWRSGRLRDEKCIPWEVEAVNAAPDCLLWAAGAAAIKVAVGGLYVVTFSAFAHDEDFCAQVCVDGDVLVEACAARGNGHPKGMVGASRTDIISLPPGAAVSALIVNGTARQALIALKKL